MAFADLSDSRAIERAAEEFDRIGRASFLEKYGFGRSREFFLEISGRHYDSKPIIAAAHGYQFPAFGPLKYSDFSGGEATVQRKLEALGFRVVVQKEVAPDFMSDEAGVAEERAHRLALWNELQSIGQESVKPSHLNELKVFYGGRGIWVDKARTAGIGGSVHGVTVGFLHTGSTYADELSDDGVLYHYPQTEVPGRDTAEIEATKAARRLKLPVFVVTYPSPSSSSRRVYIGWVEDWDDNERWFLVTFGDAAPVIPPPPDDTAPFAGINAKSRSTRKVKSRPNQPRFKFKVFQRYGAACAACGLNVPEMLEAAHIIPDEYDGADDPRNGLVLCCNHHRAYDKGLFLIDPKSLKLRFTGPNSSGTDLRIMRADLLHLARKPHPEALQWRWDRLPEKVRDEAAG